MNLTDAKAVLAALKVDNIHDLDDLPNDVGGLSARQLKDTFDKAGVDLKAFLLDLIDAISAGDEAAARGITQTGMPGSMIQNGTITTDKLISVSGEETVTNDVIRNATISESKFDSDFQRKIAGFDSSISGNVRNIASNASNIRILQNALNNLNSNKQAKHITATVELEPSMTEWEKTVTAASATNTVFVSAEPDSIDEASRIKVILAGQSAGKLRFKSKRAPNTTVRLNICIFN